MILVIPGQPEGLSPDSILTTVVMDSGLALRAPRNGASFYVTCFIRAAAITKIPTAPAETSG